MINQTLNDTYEQFAVEYTTTSGKVAYRSFKVIIDRTSLTNTTVFVPPTINVTQPVNTTTTQSFSTPVVNTTTQSSPAPTVNTTTQNETATQNTTSTTTQNTTSTTSQNATTPPAENGPAPAPSGNSSEQGAPTHDFANNASQGNSSQGNSSSNSQKPASATNAGTKTYGARKPTTTSDLPQINITSTFKGVQQNQTNK